MRIMFEKIVKVFQKDFVFIVFLATLVIVFFRNAFQTEFFTDDFFFLHISKASDLASFIHFFSPFKTYFYRPIPTELFYFVIQLLGNNIFLAHLIVFVFYFIGLVFLYKCIVLAIHNKTVAKLSVFLYAIHFSHVFQLYQLATAQEIALFAFLAISFYFFIARKVLLSCLFFVFAIMSKESAILYPFFVFAYQMTFRKNKLRSCKIVIPYFVISLVSFFFLKSGLQSVETSEEIYQIQMSVRLFANNLMWYLLWAFGIPNFFPAYFVSIFKKPIPKFWENFENIDFKLYVAFYIGYIVLTLSCGLALARKLIKNYQKVLLLILFLLLSFCIFIATTLLISHKWMVRLTIPLIFVAIAQAFLIAWVWRQNFVAKCLTVILIASYLGWNYFGIQLHESSSTYFLETRIIKNTRRYFENHDENIKKYQKIYFVDPEPGKVNPWFGSKKLDVTFHGQDFLDFFFPNSNMVAIYGYKAAPVPNDAYIIRAREDILLPDMKFLPNE